jgi:hypothetical protein
MPQPRKFNSSASLGFEAKLSAAADALSNNMDGTGHKNVFFGLIFPQVNLGRLRGQVRGFALRPEARL